MGARGEVLLWCSALPSLLLLGRSYTLVLCFLSACWCLLPQHAAAAIYILRAAVRFVCLYETADLVNHVPRMIPINRYEDFLLLLLLLLLLWCGMCAEKSAIESESLIFIGTSYEYKNFDFQHVDSQKWLPLLCRFFVRTVAIYSRGSVTHSLLFFIHESCDTRYQVYKMYIRFPPHFFVKKCTVVPGTYVPGTRGQTTFFIHIK